MSSVFKILRISSSCYLTLFVLSCKETIAEVSFIVEFSSSTEKFSIISKISRSLFLILLRYIFRAPRNLSRVSAAYAIFAKWFPINCQQKCNKIVMNYETEYNQIYALLWGMSKIKFQESENLRTKTESNQILKTTLLTQPRVQQLQKCFTENLW